MSHTIIYLNLWNALLPKECGNTKHILLHEMFSMFISCLRQWINMCIYMYQFVKITVVENNSIKEHLPFQNLSSNLRNALVDMHLKLRIQFTFFSFSSITNIKQNLISYSSNLIPKYQLNQFRGKTFFVFILLLNFCPVYSIWKMNWKIC